MTPTIETSEEDPQKACHARVDSVHTQTKKDLLDSTTPKRTSADICSATLLEPELEDDSKLEVNAQEHKLYFDRVDAERHWWTWYDLRDGTAGLDAANEFAQALLLWVLAGTRVAVRGLELWRNPSDAQSEFERVSESGWPKRPIQTLLVWNSPASTSYLQPTLFIIGLGSDGPPSGESSKAMEAKQEPASQPPLTALATCQGLRLEEYLDILSRCGNLLKTMDARYHTSDILAEADEVIVRILVPVVRQTIQLFTGHTSGFPGNFHDFGGCDFSFGPEPKHIVHEATRYQSRLAKIQRWLSNSVSWAMSDAREAYDSRTAVM